MSKESNNMKNNSVKDISTQHRNELKSLMQSLDEATPSIVCSGLLNAGKSTLLNALVGDTENNTFLTADIRETTESKRVIVNKQCFIDTPGLDAKDQDTQVVLETLKKADVVLFVHNINTGEFDPAEFDFLKQILKHWNDSKSFMEQTIFVLSKIDAIYSEDEDRVIEETQNKIEQQVYSLFHSKPVIVSVSAKSYQDGVNENENLLQEYSNFSSLRNQIERISQEKISEIHNNKIQRIERKFQEIKKLLQTEKRKLEKEKVVMLEHYKNQKNEFVKEVLQLNEVLRVKKLNYGKLK